MESALALARTLHVAAGLGLFGAALFEVAVARPALAGAPGAAARLGPTLWRLRAACLAVALAAGLVWFALQTAAMAGHGIIAGPSALATALTGTQFGRVLILRLLLLLLALACLLGERRHVARRTLALAGLAAGGAALAAHAAVGHAIALAGAERAILNAGQALHLAAAGAWLGGLPALLILLLTCGPDEAGIAGDAARRFSPIGIVAVAILALTAALNFVAFVGDLPGLVGTTYGRLALAKAVLFVLLLGIAALNRYRLAPALAEIRPPAAAALARFRLSVAAEVAVGGGVLVLAGFLATTPPAVHEQPWWPFSLRLSTAALAEPELYIEIAGAAFAATAGLALLVAGVTLRRRRWPALMAGIALILWAAPSAGLLTVEAYPTSFWRSPTGFSAASIADGARLFPTYCASCHGARGDGRDSTNRDAADLTAPHVWEHSDGDIFWWLAHGKGDRAMPGFADQLDAASRWHLVDFVHANAAGADPPHPIPAPDFDLACPGSEAARLSELRGRIVHVVFAPARGEATLAGNPDGIVTILVGDAPVPPAACTASGADLALAYGVAAGADVAAMNDAEFVVDGGGYLRARRLQGEGPPWDEAALADAVAAARRPLGAAPASHGHAH